ncbi:MAG TPA: twitch domain-containing radical SAM protein [Pseudobdellovibrionaceae bacterium]|nr:twitch domain-containing radical SAM protein [Pseudobdellovibrionaceae bacterium]
MSQELSPSFCPLLWSHLVLKKNQPVIPCCSYTGAGVVMPEGSAAAAALDSDYFQELRAKARRGEKIAGCHRCYASEVASGESNRTTAIRDFPFDPSAEAKLRSVELNLGNLCNLRCRGCNSSSSSKWVADEIKLGMTPAGGKELQTQPSSILDGYWRDLRHLKLLGGETFLNPEHEVLLKNLLEKADPRSISLFYSTNGTVRVSPFVLQAWEHFEKVEISFSVDGFKEKNDRFRQGSRWQEVIENMHWYLQNTQRAKMEWTIHTVVNMSNVDEIDLIDDWLLSEFPDFWLTKDCLIEPDWLNIRHLEPTEKTRLLEKYRALGAAHSSRKRKRGYLNIAHFLATQPQGEIDKFREMNEKLDRLNES